MTVSTTEFVTSKPTPWAGRYAKIPGNTSVFHIETVNGRLCPTVRWVTEDGTGTCPAVDSPTSQALTEAVIAAKQVAGGSGTGAFTINEFGQVLVPASAGDGRVLFAGQLKGSLPFEDVFEDQRFFDLADASDLHCGDPWKLPYVGMQFNLSGRGKIYFWKVDEDGGKAVNPPQQDVDLISKLREVRSYGAVRFIVNYAGLVLTKCPIVPNPKASEDWQPVFVGRINKTRWFEQE